MANTQATALDDTVSIAMAGDMIRYFVSKNQPFALWGPPGSGKSQETARLAKELGFRMVDIRLSLMESVDMRGLPWIQDGRAVWCPPEVIFGQPEGDTRPPLIFFDEIDRASSSAVQAVAMQITLDRKIGEHTLPKGAMVAAAGNAETDRTGTQRLSLALCDRLAHINVHADIDTWSKWAIAANLDPTLIAFLRFRPETLAPAPTRGAKTFPTPRSWAAVSGDASAPAHIRTQLLTAQVGAAAAAEYEGFLRVYETLPSIDLCVTDPTGAPVPTDAAARYAIATALSAYATEENFSNCLEYVGRIGAEFAVMVASDATQRKRALSHTPAFVAFAEKYSAVLFANHAPGSEFAGDVFNPTADGGPADARATVIAGAGLRRAAS